MEIVYKSWKFYKTGAKTNNWHYFVEICWLEWELYRILLITAKWLITFLGSINWDYLNTD